MSGSVSASTKSTSLLRKCPPDHALNRLGHIAVSFVGRQNAIAYLNSAVFSRPAAIQQHLVQAQRYIARAEYGYQGIVMTDWVTPMTGDARSAHRDSQAQYVAAAGGDLFMPGNKGDYDNLLQGIDSGAVTLEQVKINASRVVRTVRALTQE